LERIKASIRAERKKNMSMLETKLPTRFVKMLDRGVPVASVSMAFESVTVLHVKIDGMNVDCGRADATGLVEAHRTVIEDLDAIIGSYEHVCKVDTKIPGTFLVVAGIDEVGDVRDQSRLLSCYLVMFLPIVRFRTILLMCLSVRLSVRVVQLPFFKVIAITITILF